ncbi:hypothetical protein Tco_1235185 [Tanacetum coccineum]
MAAEVPQTLEYRGGQLNGVVVLENGPYVPMTAGQKKPAIQWTGDERKAANLDHRPLNLYLTEKELHQLHLDEEALREILKGKAMDEKAREEKIRQKQVDDDEFFFEFGVVRYDLEYESSD